LERGLSGRSGFDSHLGSGKLKRRVRLGAAAGGMPALRSVSRGDGCLTAEMDQEPECPLICLSGTLPRWAERDGVRGGG